MRQKVSKVLLSIKPQFANEIFNGNKLYEFRKAIFKNRDVKTIIVYASSPVQKVIGEFEIEEIINEAIPSLWNITKRNAGITRDYFDKYFQSKDSGYAIKIKNPVLYNAPLCLKKDFNITPPQSFAYVK
jgi:predicted transcriptional regulator